MPRSKDPYGGGEVPWPFFELIRDTILILAPKSDFLESGKTLILLVERAGVTSQQARIEVIFSRDERFLSERISEKRRSEKTEKKEQRIKQLWINPAKHCCS
jgi:hypothetical protein